MASVESNDRDEEAPRGMRAVPERAVIEALKVVDPLRPVRLPSQPSKQHYDCVGLRRNACCKKS